MIERQSGITIQSALAKNAASTTSANYKFFNTKILIDKLLEKNWKVHKETEARTYNPLKKGFQRHMVIFKNKEYASPEGELQVVVRNSHDSSSSVEIFAGFMRIVCANQLFTRNLGTGSLIRVRHNVSHIEEKVLMSFDKMVEFLPMYDKVIRLLMNKKLTHTESIEFADRAIQFRFSENPGGVRYLSPEAVLMSRRKADESYSAWTVLNRVQENLTKAGLSYPRIGKNGKMEMTKLRAFSSIRKVPEFNDYLMNSMLEISGVG